MGCVRLGRGAVGDDFPDAVLGIVNAGEATRSQRLAEVLQSEVQQAPMSLAVREHAEHQCEHLCALSGERLEREPDLTTVLGHEFVGPSRQID